MKPAALAIAIAIAFSDRAIVCTKPCDAPTDFEQTYPREFAYPPLLDLLWPSSSLIWGVAKGSSISWVEKFKGDNNSECKLSNGWSRSYKAMDFGTPPHFLIIEYQKFREGCIREAGVVQSGCNLRTKFAQDCLYFVFVQQTLRKGARN